jgi:hypothetical protein
MDARLSRRYLEKNFCTGEDRAIPFLGEFQPAHVRNLKLDRLSRSLKELLHIMEKIGEAGAGFRPLTEHTTRPRPPGG